MKTMHQKKQEENKNSIRSVVAGAVAIAGVAVAATMVLKDEKTREKVKKVLTNVKDQAIDNVNKLKTGSSSEEKVETIKKIVTDVKKLVEKSI